jgi:hypothetical protein
VGGFGGIVEPPGAPGTPAGAEGSGDASVGGEKKQILQQKYTKIFKEHFLTG